MPTFAFGVKCAGSMEAEEISGPCPATRFAGVASSEQIALAAPVFEHGVR